MEQNMDVARAMGLDFIVATEHNTNSGQTFFESIQADYPDVLLIPGIEWTTYYGHANAFGATEWVDHRLGTRGATTEGAITAFHDQGALFSINHPQVPAVVQCTGCGWELDVDGTTIDGVEVFQGNLPGTVFWEDLLDDGSRAAAIGGSDDHRGGEGTPDFLYTPIGFPTTMVYAEELSVEGILAGIRSGRTVVKVAGPNGPMLETELEGERVGDTVFADESTLSVVVTGGIGFTLVVYKNGEPIDEILVSSDPFTDERGVTAPETGEDRYRHQLDGDGGTTATVGGYVWLSKGTEPPPGTGGEAGGGGGSGGSPPSSDGSSGCNCGVVSAAGYDTALLVALMFMLFGAWRATARRSRRRL
jgi:predicted metal-dependent phosphoesterase TrpH